MKFGPAPPPRPRTAAPSPRAGRARSSSSPAVGTGWHSGCQARRPGPKQNAAAGRKACRGAANAPWGATWARAGRAASSTSAARHAVTPRMGSVRGRKQGTPSEGSHAARPPAGRAASALRPLPPVGNGGTPRGSRPAQAPWPLPRLQPPDLRRAMLRSGSPCASASGLSARARRRKGRSAPGSRFPTTLATCSSTRLPRSPSREAPTRLVRRERCKEPLALRPRVLVSRVPRPGAALAFLLA